MIFFNIVAVKYKITKIYELSKIEKLENCWTIQGSLGLLSNSSPKPKTDFIRFF